MYYLQRIEQELARRKRQESYRHLSCASELLLDFSSNDYLGFNTKTWAQITDFLPHGSTSSRLLRGNTKTHEELEFFLAELYQSEAALLCNSGYDANLILASSLPKRGDLVFCDALIHASVHDGLRLGGKAELHFFEHNNPEHLGSLLGQLPCKGQIWIFIESVYSMDGDTAKLDAFVALAKEYSAELIIDEAHALGVFGRRALGLAEELSGAIRLYTFGKALALHGACILCSALVRDYLINTARPLIYSTALAPSSLGHIRQRYEFLLSPEGQACHLDLRERIEFFCHLAKNKAWAHCSGSAIQACVLGSNKAVLAASAYVAKEGFDLRPIRYPTVALGQERLRICLHSFNSLQSIEKLVEVLDSFSASYF